MRLTHNQRIEIVTLQEEGYTYRQLAEHFNVRPATISELIIKYRRTGSEDDQPRPGRHRISTERQDRSLVRLVSQNPSTSSRALSQQWAETSGVQAAARTVRHRLFTSGLYSYVATRKPLLTARHHAVCLCWARKHVNWTRDQWNRVLFSDETPVHLVQTTQQLYYRSRRGVGRV